MIKVKRDESRKDYTFILGITTLALLMLVNITGAAPYAYVASQDSRTISILDISTNTVVDKITDVGIAPCGIAFTPDGKKAYVTQTSGNSVLIIDTSSRTVIGNVSMPSSNSRGIAITPDGKRAYITNEDGNNITILDISTNTIIGSIENLGYTPLGIGITPDGNKAYVSRHGGGILIINISDNTVIRDIPNLLTYYALGIGITPDGKKAYVQDYYSIGKIINTSDDTVIGDMENFGYLPWANDIKITPDGTKAYITDYWDNSIIIIDLSSNTVIQKLDGIIYRPAGIAFCPIVASSPTIPVASFSANTTSGYAPLTVQFNDTSQNAADCTYSWNFGDGTSSTDENPVHTFSEAGVYTVNLTVSNENGTDSKLATITVDSLPYYSGNGHYYNAVSVSGSITWTDAKTAAESSTYLGMSGHLATITSQGENDFIYNNLGVPQDNRNYWMGAFQPDGSQEPDGGWQWVTGELWDYTNWDFGQPDNFGGEDALQFYYGTGKWNDLHHYLPQSGYVVEYEPTHQTPVIPIANFSSNVTSGSVPLSVQFTGLSENATGWNWDFGDGISSEEQNPVHIYSNSGKYTVSLTVENADGRNSTSKSNYINVIIPNVPAAAFSASPTYGNAPLTVTFTDKSTNSPDSWEWSFGDGTSSNDQNSVHTYSNSGQYTVKLTVTNAAGSTTALKSSYIIATNTLKSPTAAFSAFPTYGNSPLTVTFTDKSTNSPDSWEWSFGDGSSSTEQNPVHTYSNSGQYTVKLTVKNAAGSTTALKSSYIIVKNFVNFPSASFSASPTYGNAPLTVTFTDKSTNSPDSWEWSFGDGSSSTEQNPVHTYSNSGQYTVKLTVNNAAGNNTKIMSGYIIVKKQSTS